ncbi:hypothetical protein CEXT_538031 [Caerostris extrusa]|uniref:Uncharacterized protein n=1 Tax=Caerostris extrusa TaxID=172846 RepID=A0AAV4XMV8_CAEEX|nr:hypothetical protein CEXT_538031 [Caerostris extrusa]
MKSSVQQLNGIFLSRGYTEESASEPPQGRESHIFFLLKHSPDLSDCLLNLLVSAKKLYIVTVLSVPVTTRPQIYIEIAFDETIKAFGNGDHRKSENVWHRTRNLWIDP